MGEVFRAEDVDLGRTVAIKVVKLGQLRADAAHSAIQRFLQEARAAAAITHPNIPVIYRVGVEAGWPYIVMEWIDGPSLEAMLDGNRRLTFEQASRLGLQMLSALDAAHAVGVVHRDIKPGNLMLTHEGRLKVMDFGIARVRGSTALAHTQAGLILGTPWYAAPEQLAGLAIDCRVDLYGVGCVLYEAVTGHAPYEADTIYELMAVIHRDSPPRPSACDPAIPAAFDAIVVRALAKDPDERFATARDMARALEPMVTPSNPATAARRSSAPTARDVPKQVVDGVTAAAIVTATSRSWPASALGRQETSHLLSRLIERPLHARAFCGAVELGGAWLLVSDGLIYAAFDPTSGRSGDRLLESLPREVEATLRAVPDRLDADIVPLLASLLLEPPARTPTLDASLTDLGGLADKLATTGFDGALRLVREPGAGLGFVLFRKGRRVLDLFGTGWPPFAETTPWEDWITESAAHASVEELRVAFPSITFRQQLSELSLDVIRPAASASSSLRFDTAATANAIELVPREESRARLRRGETVLQTLVDADPAHAIARWLLAELSRQFEQYGRSTRWKALVSTIDALEEIRLHHRIASMPEAFDVATYDARGRLHHVIERVALGTEAAIEHVVERADACRAAHPAFGGAILVAPRFEEDALAAYLRLLRGDRRSLLGGLDAFRHREGFRRTGSGGYHLLLVEDDGHGHRRPLVPE